MKIRIKGIYEKTKRLASGQIAVCIYHRRTGARIHEVPGTVEFLQRIEALNHGPKPVANNPRSVSALFRDYRESAHFNGLAARTKAEYRRALTTLEPMIGAFQVSEIRRKHVTAIRNKIAAEKPAWANAVVRVLSATMTYAVEELEWIDASPCVKLKLPKGGDGQTPYTEAEIQRFRDKTPRGTRARLAFEILLCTAARISDATFVETDQLRGQFIDIVSQKTGVLTVAGSTDEVVAAFKAWEAANEEEQKTLGRFVLGGTADKPLNRRTLTVNMEEAYKAAGFPPEKRTHALRYTAAIRLLEAGYSIEDIQEVTGHKMASMAMKYCEKKRNSEKISNTFNSFDSAAPI